MKKILITGGAGFIGAEIVYQLSKTGEWNIIVLDSMSEQIHGKDWKSSFLYKKIEGKCTFIYGSVCNLSKVQDAIKGCEYIVHLAAETGTGQSMYQINLYNETNVMGTSNLLQAILLGGKDSRIRKIILSSSRAVYGEGKYECSKCGVVFPQSRSKERMREGDFGVYCPKCGGRLKMIPTTEDSILSPSSLYAYTKWAQERMLQTMCPALGVDYTIFRFQNVYGVGQSLNNPYTGILSIFSTLMLSGKPVNIFEDGRESRDFINVSDVARGVISCLDNEESNGEIINLGCGISTSVIEIAELLKKHYQSQSPIVISGDFRIGDIANNCADITKAKRLLRYEPSVSIVEGLNEFCGWVKEQNNGCDGYSNSLSDMEKVGMFIRKK